MELFHKEAIYLFGAHGDGAVSFSPAETKKHHGSCPQCKKELTIGVLNRVDSLATRTTTEINPKQFVPFKNVIPLKEILADIMTVGKHSKKVDAEYLRMIKTGGNEFNILLRLTKEQLENISSKQIAEGVIRVREGKVKLTPGFDGRYGTITLFSDQEKHAVEQTKLF